jgi:hypothetical protein
LIIIPKLLDQINKRILGLVILNVIQSSRNKHVFLTLRNQRHYILKVISKNRLSIPDPDSFVDILLEFGKIELTPAVYEIFEIAVEDDEEKRSWLVILEEKISPFKSIQHITALRNRFKDYWEIYCSAKIQLTIEGGVRNFLDPDYLKSELVASEFLKPCMPNLFDLIYFELGLIKKNLSSSSTKQDLYLQHTDPLWFNFGLGNKKIKLFDSDEFYLGGNKSSLSLFFYANGLSQKKEWADKYIPELISLKDFKDNKELIKLRFLANIIFYLKYGYKVHDYNSPYHLESNLKLISQLFGTPTIKLKPDLQAYKDIWSINLKDI